LLKIGFGRLKSGAALLQLGLGVGARLLLLHNSSMSHGKDSLALLEQWSLPSASVRALRSCSSRVRTPSRVASPS
jgi:hypothetical protein